MWPLLQKDGLQIQYFAMAMLWNRLIGYNPFDGVLGRLQTFKSGISKALEWSELEWLSILSFVCYKSISADAILADPIHRLFTS
jgi:hypothetical protein